MIGVVNVASWRWSLLWQWSPCCCQPPSPISSCSAVTVVSPPPPHCHRPPSVHHRYHQPPWRREPLPGLLFSGLTVARPRPAMTNCRHRCCHRRCHVLHPHPLVVLYGRLPPTVGEQVTNKKVEIWDQSPTKDRRVWFAVDEVVREPTAEPTKQDRRAPIKIVGGCAWSPGIYQALRLLGKSLDAAWKKAFICPLTFNS